MRLVRHRPDAMQYPSMTETVWSLASKRISGMRHPKEKGRSHSARMVIPLNQTLERNGHEREMPTLRFNHCFPQYQRNPREGLYGRHLENNCFQLPRVRQGNQRTNRSCRDPEIIRIRHQVDEQSIAPVLLCLAPDCRFGNKWMRGKPITQKQHGAPYFSSATLSEIASSRARARIREAEPGYSRSKTCSCAAWRSNSRQYSVAVSGMSGGLFFFKKVWPDRHKKLDPRLWDAVYSPFGNRRRFDVAHSRYCACATEFINDVVCVHVCIIGTPKNKKQGRLIKIL